MLFFSISFAVWSAYPQCMVTTHFFFSLFLSVISCLWRVVVICSFCRRCFTKVDGFKFVQNANYLPCDHKRNFYINNFGVAHNQDLAFHTHIHLFAHFKCNKAFAIYNTFLLWKRKRTWNRALQARRHEMFECLNVWMSCIYGCRLAHRFG